MSLIYAAVIAYPNRHYQLSAEVPALGVVVLDSLDEMTRAAFGPARGPGR